VLLDAALALGAGVATVASPCVLPTLPILFGTSLGRDDRGRPVLIAAGFIATFCLLALGLDAAGTLLGVRAETWRTTATVVLALCGVLMIWPRPFALVSAAFPGPLNRLGGLGGLGGRGDGRLGAVLVGASLGAVWTPCAGPVLASIVSLVAATPGLGAGAALLVCFAVGASVPMLAIAYGGQWATTRVRALAPYAHGLQRAFGLVVVLVAALLWLRWDVALAAHALDDAVADDATDAAADRGPAPELAGITRWLNSEPLSMAGLRGRVVLVDFWTYDCINCARTLPWLSRWYAAYASRGFVVVGVHTPEFAFERDPANVAAAVARFGIGYPVAEDGDWATWRAWGNHDWPTEYLIDQRGHVVRTHVGEGGYAEMERAIRALLDDAEAARGVAPAGRGQLGQSG